MKRGDIISIALQGDFGKPRPALIIQSNQFNETMTVTVLLISSTLVDAPLIRLNVEPSNQNGLLKKSQIMVDKIMTVKRDKIGDILGSVEDKTLLEATRLLAVFLGFA
jgi:mRNA interferase MazF